MTSNIVVVGSCMIDFACYSSRLPKPGETIRGNSFHVKYGGKGGNQCVAAARLGASTALVASLGSDTFGQDYLDVLKKENVNASFVQIQKDKQSGIAHITVAENGENCIVIVPGANDYLSPEHVITSAELIKNATVLLCQFETPLDATLHALRIHKGHGLSIVNAAPAIENVDPEIFKLCDIFCVNETEVGRKYIFGILEKDTESASQDKMIKSTLSVLSELGSKNFCLQAEVITGVQPLSLSNAQEAIDILLAKGCNFVILTLGPLGAVYASQDNKKITQILTTKVQPIDTTGAGDAFLGSLAYFKAYHPHLSTSECIRRACEIATKSVLKTGTQESFPTKSDLPRELFL